MKPRYRIRYVRHFRTLMDAMRSHYIFDVKTGRVVCIVFIDNSIRVI